MVCPDIVIIVTCDGIDDKPYRLLIPLHIFQAYLEGHCFLQPELHHIEFAYICAAELACVALLPSALCSIPCYPWMAALSLLTGCTFTTCLNPAVTFLLVFLYTHIFSFMLQINLCIDYTIYSLFKLLHKSFSLEN